MTSPVDYEISGGLQRARGPALRAGALEPRRETPNTLKLRNIPGAGRLLKQITFITLAAFFCCQSSNAEGAAAQLGINPYCNAAVQDGDTRGLDQSQIKRLDVVILNVRKWAKNNFRILRTRSKNILARHKKRFDGTIVAHFANGLKCSFKARLRQSGDEKDHIQFRGGNIINSLDVRLTDGHLNGIVRFKLLIPDTREGKNEVILANLLRTAGFLAPRTALLKVDLMGHPLEMIFQENQRKELLEDHYLREGPLLEGDERFMWATTEIKGMSEPFDASLVFSRLTNNNWAAKGQSSLEISKQAVRQLNNIYLKARYLRYVKKIKKIKLYLDNYLLANGDPLQLRRLNEFNALLRASNAGHALFPNNRRFYYDPMYGYFHPIYYDGDARFGKLKPKHGIMKFAVEGAPGAIKIIERIDPQGFRNVLEKAGVRLTASDVAAIFQTLKENLRLISKMETPDFSTAEFSSPLEYLKEIQKRRQDNISLIQFSTRNKSAGTCDLCPANACDLLLTSCRPIKLDIEESGELLAGKLRIRNKPTLFQDLSRKSAPDRGRDMQTRVSRAIASDVEVITSPRMKVSEDVAAKTVTFRQEISSDWALLRGGSLDGVTIKFEGKPRVGNAPANAQRFNYRLLTGCLSLVDMTVDKLKIAVDSGGCEDGVNLVRVKGLVSSIKVSNAAADAIDIDFSKISVGDIEIHGAGNDCLDVSAGTYAIKSLQASNCGDKAISVGEGSRIRIDGAVIDQANTAVAVKDSSRLNATKLQVRRAKSCISAYRKKQEFSGAIVRVAESICNGAAIHADLGSAIITRRAP